MKIKPYKIRLEACSACQLKCHSCPTASGETKKAIGTGILKFPNFKKLIDSAPWVKEIELSNYGEILLNKQLPQIMEYAYKKGVSLKANNGVNLNNVKDEVLEAMVRYQFKGISLSIDGVTQSSYSKYRIAGNLDTVMQNIKKLNYYKQKYNYQYPELKWQFIVFGHNQYDIPKAKELAKELNMKIWFKLNWDANFSPITDQEFVQKELGWNSFSRNEYFEKSKEDYIGNTCYQLWTSPQINWDGKILGCCLNFWGDFGKDTFEKGLLASLNNEKINYARDMLQGKKEMRDDIPCSTCSIYLNKKAQGKWITDKEIRKLNLACSHKWQKIKNTFIGTAVKKTAKVIMRW